MATQIAFAREEVPIASMAGQMIMVGFRGADPEKEKELFAPLLEDIKYSRVGGVILFDKDMLTQSSTRNILSYTQVKKLTKALQKEASLPLFIAIDQEGGRVQRLGKEQGAPSLPTAEQMGKDSVEQTTEHALALSSYLADVGINVNFAPVLDVNRNANSPAIGALSRSFSSDPKVVTDHARGFVKGMLKNRIIPVFKHFPGHGSARADSHKGVTDITDSWSEQELDPYAVLSKEDPAAMVMVAHVMNKYIDKEKPATLSYSFITKLLREKLNWKGVVISDDLNMGAITDIYSMKEAMCFAVNAGVDILLYGNNLSFDPKIGRKAYQTLLELVAEGKISEERISQSYKRIKELKQKLEGSKKTLF